MNLMLMPFLLSFPGLLLAATSIGPALGFITGSIIQRFYVDFDKFPKGDRKHGVKKVGNASTEVEFNSFSDEEGRIGCLQLFHRRCSFPEEDK